MRIISISKINEILLNNNLISNEDKGSYTITYDSANYIDFITHNSKSSANLRIVEVDSLLSKNPVENVKNILLFLKNQFGNSFMINF